MGVEQNRQAALRMLEAVGARDVATLGDLMSDDATWWTIGRGPREAATPRADFLETLPAVMGQLFAGPVRFTVKGVTAEGDRVAVEADSEAELANGKTYANLYHFLFVFQDGKIAAVREYNDTAYMNASFG